MKIDSFGCVVMEGNGDWSDWGDSCAETGRMFVLRKDNNQAEVLLNFVTPKGFVRHPNMPVGRRESDFTSDQLNYLLMAAHLHYPELAGVILRRLKRAGWETSPGKKAHLATRLLAKKKFHLLALNKVAQMGFNALPFRWHDGHEFDKEWSWFRRTFWRWRSSEGSTVSFMTTYVTAVFLKKVGIKWFGRIFPKDKYLQKTLDYYRWEKNVDWFQDLYRQADL